MFRAYIRYGNPASFKEKMLEKLNFIFGKQSKNDRFDSNFQPDNVRYYGRKSRN